MHQDLNLYLPPPPPPPPHTHTHRKSASCVHVSALLHAVVGLYPSEFTPPGNTGQTVGETEDPLPITSYTCKWVQPRKRKESNTKIADAVFEKHVYGRQRKHMLQPIEDFDPRPPEAIGTANIRLTEFLDSMQGKSLGVSSLFDAKLRVWKVGSSSASTSDLQPRLPSKEELVFLVSAFKESLKVSPEKAREIERDTKDQHASQLWHSVRKYRLTASCFGEVRRRLSSTPPDSLVMRILGIKRFSVRATDWGKQFEEKALKSYVEYQHAAGHDSFMTCRSGFVICEAHPFLGASPDAYAYDLTLSQPFGLVEIKCPYSHRNETPEEACKAKDFCCSLEKTLTGSALKLKKNHIYYSQVQGQMAISQRNWCDFVIYTNKGLSVERITFDSVFWESELLPKLTSFYDNCVAPEIVSPMHTIGLPIRNLMRM